LADGWDETTVTFDTQPTVGNLLQTIDIAASFTGAVSFDNAAVNNYLEAQRTGDGTASFLLRLDSGTGDLGFE
jgi:hypothetical protein